MSDLYAEVTARIIADLESGVAPWARPWACSAMPQNATSGKAYRGINVLLLWATGRGDQRWLTFKQAQELGAHVRKGEKGTRVYFFKPWALRDVNSAGEEVERSIPVMRAFTVFNVEQIEGLPEKYAPKAAQVTATDYPRAESLMAQAKVSHGGDRAYYSPSADAIQLPARESFADEPAYYATALHELAHWTGHEKRCAREFGKRFGDAAYAAEELVAEIAAAYMCAQTGIQYTTQHASYVASWVKVLKNDKRAILTAASAAQKAADFAMAGTEDQAEEDAALCA